jgi:hypothetical protein
MPSVCQAEHHTLSLSLRKRITILVSGQQKSLHVRKLLHVNYYTKIATRVVIFAGKLLHNILHGPAKHHTLYGSDFAATVFAETDTRMSFRPKTNTTSNYKITTQNLKITTQKHQNYCTKVLRRSGINLRKRILQSVPCYENCYSSQLY